MKTKAPASNSFLDSVIEHIPIRIFWKDRDSRYLGCNTVFARDAGCTTRSDVIGKTDFDLDWKDMAEQYRADDDAVMSTDVPKLSYEECLESPDKPVILARMSKVPIHDANNQVIGLVGLYQDVTSLKQEQLEQLKRDEYLSSLLAVARDAIIILDGESGTVLEWSHAAELIFGYTKDAMIGRNLHDTVVPVRFRNAAAKAMIHFSSTGAGDVIDKTRELTALHQNGSEFPIELSLSAMCINNKWFACGIARDITARKLAEDAERRATTLFRTLFESSADAILLYSPETGFIDCNAAALALFRAKRDGLIGKRSADISPPTQPDGRPSQEVSAEHVAAAMKNGSVLFEGVRRRMDGTEFPAEILLMVTEVDGKLILQDTVRDITARKAAEASEQRYRRLFESAKDGILILDAETGMIVDANPFILGLLGISREACIQKPVWEVNAFTDEVLSKERFAELQQKGYVRYEDIPLKTAQGAVVHVEFISNVYLVGGQRVVQCNIRDISRRWIAEERGRRLTQLYHTVSHCNQALVRATDELQLSEAMCKVLIAESSLFQAIWVGYIEQDAEKLIHIVASAGMETALLEGFRPAWEDTDEEIHALAIRAGKIQVLHDTSQGETGAERALRQHDYGSAAAIPFKVNGLTQGILVVYSREPNTFSDEVVALIDELAMDISFGIDNLRARAERLGILEKLDHSLDHAVTAIAATVEMRDPYTAGHQRRVAKLAVEIARRMGLSPDRIQGLHMACVVHDIGKIHVPAEILSSPAKLSDAEFSILKTHAKIGWDILKGIDFPWPVAEIVYQHHERQDGSGYPRGLKGDEILMEARILVVADVVEAMSSHRPYRPAFGIYAALQEVSRNKGTLYDVAAVDACIWVFLETDFQW